MSLLDWVIVIILIVSTLAAARSGLMVEIFSLGGLIVGLLLACWHYQHLVPWMMGRHMDLQVAKVVSFLVIAVGVMILAGILGRILRWSVHAVGLGWLDRTAGAVFGLIKGAVLVVVMIVALLAFLPKTPLVRNSHLAPDFLSAAHSVAGVSPAELSGEIHNGITILQQEKNKLFTQKAGVS